MLDHRWLLDAPEEASRLLARRGSDPQLLAAAVQAAAGWLAGRRQLEGLRQEMNQAQAKVRELARQAGGEQVAVAAAALRSLKADIKAAEERDATANDRLRAPLLQLPNPPHPEVPDGAGADDNPVVRCWGRPRDSAGMAPHWNLAEAADLVDFGRAAGMSGARFVIMRASAARLERALASLMLEMAGTHGYQEVGVPLLVLPEAMEVAGQYPKFIGEAFATEEHAHVLIPTAEVPLVNLHRGEILAAEQVPARYVAWTPCFRRESGAAGRDTRGLIRLHQFYKVELVSLVAPADSDAELERMLGHAEAVLQRLELPYQVVALCAGDLGFAARRTYDLEVWLPGQGAFREISSVSSCGDFQARRGQIRWRRGPNDRPQLLHTLNGSALAVGRTLVAVLENGQQADGSILLPSALQPYVRATYIDAKGALQS